MKWVELLKGCRQSGTAVKPYDIPCKGERTDIHSCPAYTWRNPCNSRLWEVNGGVGVVVIHYKGQSEWWPGRFLQYTSQNTLYHICREDTPTCLCTHVVQSPSSNHHRMCRCWLSKKRTEGVRGVDLPVLKTVAWITCHMSSTLQNK